MAHYQTQKKEVIMKIGQAVFPIMLFGLLFFVASCDNAYAPFAQQRAEQVQVEVGPGVEQVVIFMRTSNGARLQGDVNAWLNQNHGKVEIVRVLQSQSGRLTSRITISIFYKKMGQW
jgi:hypothetical protein